MYEHDAFIDSLNEEYTPDYVHSRDIRDLGGNEVLVVDTLDDDHADLSWLGEFSRDKQDWCIDTREGLLLGAYASKTYTASKFLGESRATAKLFKLANADHFHIDSDDDNEHVEFEIYQDDDSGDWTLELSGYPVVRSRLGRGHHYDAYNPHSRYFIPARSTPPGSGWEHVSDADKAKVLQDHQTLEAADIYYMVMDWWRMDSFGYSWNFQGIVCTLYVLGQELGSDSLFGIEDDCDDSYEAEIVREQVSQIRYQLRDNDYWFWLDNNVYPFDSTDANGQPLNTSPAAVK